MIVVTFLRPAASVRVGIRPIGSNSVVYPDDAGYRRFRAQR